MELKAGLTVADRFRLVRKLGVGGMGAVWLAQHTALDVPCAVKFINEESSHSSEIRVRFEREAKAAALLRSPHVVQILDHGVWEGVAYIAMECLEGEDLGQRLHRVRVLSPADTLVIALQVGRALAKAHAAGLVHRDLKPSNIFLTQDDDREIAKVLDFGIAKVKDQSLDGETRTGDLLGTPFYMSPEQARGLKDVDHRADLWALSVVIFQCLTGHRPYKSTAVGDLLVKIITEPPPVPSQVAPVPPGFDAFWARATAPALTQRFQTAKELAEALGPALGVNPPAGAELGAPSGRGSLPSLTPAVARSVDPNPLTPATHGVSVAVVAPSRRRRVAAAAAGTLAIAGLAAVIGLRGPRAVPEAGASDQAPTPPRTAGVEAVATAPSAAVPIVVPAGPAPLESVSPSAQPSASHPSGSHTSAAHGPAPPVPDQSAGPAASATGKRRRDFGF